MDDNTLKFWIVAFFVAIIVLLFAGWGYIAYTWFINRNIENRYYFFIISLLVYPIIIMLFFFIYFLNKPEEPNKERTPF